MKLKELFARRRLVAPIPFDTLTNVRVSASDAPPTGRNAHVSKRVAVTNLVYSAPVWGVALCLCAISACGGGNNASVTPQATPTPPGITDKPVSQPPSTEVKYVQSAGVVIAVNPAFPSVELNHEEIKGIMPAMQMEFYVKDKAMLNGLKPGDKVSFTLEDKGGAELITELKKK